MTTVIRAENLGKKYLIRHEQQGRRFHYDSLGESLVSGGRAFCKKLLHPFSSRSKIPTQEEFWALKDINFEIQQGDRVGIIGRNGAGKSTLLKILSRITKPTTGQVRIKGRVASLLEVGTGFHPELTGRENIYLNGAILGMRRKEIARKFDEIVDFSEVEKFLDSPVKHYSSGMYVRLAFAVAAHLEPEILIVDEVLAVGDAKFQEKCINKMGSLGVSGNTILFVSHNIPSILLLASTGIAISNGYIFSRGAIDNVVQDYLLTACHSNLSSHWVGVEGDEKLAIKKLCIHPEKMGKPYFTNESIQVLICFDVFVEIEGVVVGCDLTNLHGVNLAYSAQHDDIIQNLPTKLCPGEYIFTLTIPQNTLSQGCYKIVADIGIHYKKRIVQEASVMLEMVNIEGLGHCYRAEGSRFNNLFRPAWRWTMTQIE